MQNLALVIKNDKTTTSKILNKIFGKYFSEQLRTLCQNTYEVISFIKLYLNCRNLLCSLNCMSNNIIMLSVSVGNNPLLKPSVHHYNYKITLFF